MIFFFFIIALNMSEATLSGLMVVADYKTGLAKKVEPIVVGKYLENRI